MIRIQSLKYILYIIHLFRNCNVLVQIRIRGSGPLITVPDTDPAQFVRRGNKNKLFFNFFAYLLPTVGTFSSDFKNNKLNRSHNTVEIKFFYLYFCL
jgi:hypothetical protein